MKVFATQLLANPTLATDLKPAFHATTPTAVSPSFSSESVTPVMLNYVNTGMYTTSFATLVTTFGSNLSYNSRNSYYNPLCAGGISTHFATTTALEGLSTNSQHSKLPSGASSLELTRDVTYLSDLKLLTLFFF